MNEHSATILTVDDTPENLALVRGLLKGSYKTLFATNGDQALRIAAENASLDLILLDVMMPEIDGYEVCRRLKADSRTASIPVIFLTAKSEIKDEQQGLEMGAVDYVTKPISPPILMARIKNHLLVKQARDALAHQNERLEFQVAQRTQALAEVQDATIYAMTVLAETRDNETGNHIRRTQNYVKMLAAALRSEGQFMDELNDETIDLLYKSAPLHDIGKIGIPDRVLLKPGKLDEEEWAVMRMHTVYGSNAIASAESLLTTPNSFLRFAHEIAHSHHEKWDGSGYPQGLRGLDIPLSARLMAIADVYDALISRRVYKPPFSHEKAIAILQEGSGAHFDPEIVATCMMIADDFRKIALQYFDSDTDQSHSK